MNEDPLRVAGIDYTGDYWGPRCSQHPEKGRLVVSLYRVFGKTAYAAVFYCQDSHSDSEGYYRGRHWGREYSTLELEAMIASGALVKRGPPYKEGPILARSSMRLYQNIILEGLTD